MAAEVFPDLCVQKTSHFVARNIGIATLEHINGPSSLVFSAVASIGCFSGKILISHLTMQDKAMQEFPPDPSW